MALAPYLADTSVWARMHRPAVYASVAPLVEAGLVGTCGVVDLEVLYGARTADEHAQLIIQRSGLPWIPMPDEVWDRAREVQGLLAARGQHRAASIPDLLVAATAERHRVTVLHYDSDFDLIGAVTGQPARWAVARGTA